MGREWLLEVWVHGGYSDVMNGAWLALLWVIGRNQAQLAGQADCVPLWSLLQSLFFSKRILISLRWRRMVIRGSLLCVRRREEMDGILGKRIASLVVARVGEC